ncbi:hypothetical protein BDW02DRAFT_19231 [Decorospora gaudefroyi]|uniref:Uncharacterized protein n=1 Tax=Decorospora gaudefroyi TaxID=184978 RepID=A0A6A5K5Z0_9PLEO|nr:hypothetical protein BDW02DRAFT_19231 [Decorospora gaudefroyi]
MALATARGCHGFGTLPALHLTAQLGVMRWTNEITIPSLLRYPHRASSTPRVHHLMRAIHDARTLLVRVWTALRSPARAAEKKRIDATAAFGQRSSCGAYSDNWVVPRRKRTQWRSASLAKHVKCGRLGVEGVRSAVVSVHVAGAMAGVAPSSRSVNGCPQGKRGSQALRWAMGVIETPAGYLPTRCPDHDSG